MISQDWQVNQGHQLFGLDGDDVLRSLSGDDLLDGGAGSDLLQGGVGDDIYRFDLGDQSVEIDETVVETRSRIESYQVTTYVNQRYYVNYGESGYYRTRKVPVTTTRQRTVEETVQVDAGSDTLLFGERIKLSNLSFSSNGDDLSIRVLGDGGSFTDDHITIRDWRNSDSRIERFEFADGTTLSSISVNDNRTILQGTDGDDILGGSTGPDTFVFADDWGTDTIVGFEDGVDLISFAENDAVDGFDDLSIKQDGADMVISYGGNYIVLKDVVVDRITDDDFLFV